MSTLLDAVDHRRFLHDARDRAELTNKQLAAAIARSPSWLSQMLAGQRPFDPTLVEAFTTTLGLAPEERAHLEALVDLEAPSERARTKAWATLLATRAHRAATTRSDDMARVLSHWWVQAVHELATCVGFRADPAWIARTLVPPISEDQAAQALATLLDLGMLVPDAQGRLRQPDEGIGWTAQSLSDGVQSDAARALYAGYFPLAAEAFDRFRYNERHSGLLTFTLSEEQLDELLAKLRELEREVVVASHEEGESPNRVYVLSTQLFPLSEYTDWAPPDEDASEDA